MIEMMFLRERLLNILCMDAEVVEIREADFSSSMGIIIFPFRTQAPEKGHYWGDCEWFIAPIMCLNLPQKLSLPGSATSGDKTHLLSPLPAISLFLMAVLLGRLVVGGYIYTHRQKIPSSFSMLFFQHLLLSHSLEKKLIARLTYEFISEAVKTINR